MRDLVFKSYLDSVSVSGKSLALCNKNDVVLSLSESVLSVICVSSTLCKACNSERREETSCTACWKDVVRSCVIVAEWLGSIVTEEYRACVVKAAEKLEWVLHKDFKVLGSYLVCQLYALLTAVGNDNCTVVFKRLLDNALSGEILLLAVYLLDSLVSELLAGCYHYCRSKHVVLCL